MSLIKMQYIDGYIFITSAVTGNFFKGTGTGTSFKLFAPGIRVKDCISCFRQNIQKALGFAPSRSASKQVS
jgi:hypothetical protein